MRSLWNPYFDGEETNYDSLNNFTKVFDKCGIYDRDGNGIPYASEHEPFDSVLSFMNWYKVPKMEDFGIIIIDETSDKYAAQNLDTACFKGAQMIAAGASIILLAFNLI